jgi:hypothetical protein
MIGEPVDPATNLINACAIYLAHVTVPDLIDVNPNEKVLAEMEPEEVKAFDEIRTLYRQVENYANRTMRASKKLHAKQILLWEAIYERHEIVRQQNPSPMGIRQNDEGKTVLVEVQQIPGTPGIIS